MKTAGQRKARLEAPPFRFRLGEKVLWTWRPKLLVTDLDGREGEPWRDLGPEDLPGQAAGMLCRALKPGQLPVGISRQGRWCCYVRGIERLFFVDLDGRWEDYLSRISPKRRHNLKRSLRWFAERSGGNPVTVAKDAEEMEEFHRRAVEISRQTYQHKLLGAGMPDSPEFLSGMKEAAARRMARGYLLWCDAAPVAFAWCTGHGDRLNYGVIGYLPAYARMSPGTTLLYWILESLFQEKQYRKFDFGPGEAWYKEAFGTGVEEFIDAVMLRPVWTHWTLVRLHAALESFNERAGEALDRLGVKGAVKRLMRALAGARAPGE